MDAWDNDAVKTIADDVIKLVKDRNYRVKLLVPLKASERRAIRRADEAKMDIYNCEAKLADLNARYKKLTET